jgi:hypothetical protein
MMDVAESFKMRWLVGCPATQRPASRWRITFAPLLRLHFISTQDPHNGDDFADPIVLLLAFTSVWLQLSFGFSASGHVFRPSRLGINTFCFFCFVLVLLEETTTDGAE